MLMRLFPRFASASRYEMMIRSMTFALVVSAVCLGCSVASQMLNDKPYQLYSESTVAEARTVLVGTGEDQIPTEIERSGADERVSRRGPNDRVPVYGIWASRAWRADSEGNIHYASSARNVTQLIEHAILTGTLFRSAPDHLGPSRPGFSTYVYTLGGTGSVVCAFDHNGVLAQALITAGGETTLLSDFSFSMLDRDHRVITGWRRNGRVIFSGSLSSMASDESLKPRPIDRRWPIKTVLPISMVGGVPVVDARIGGRSVRLALDSGSVGLTLSERVAVELNLRSSPLAESAEVYIGPLRLRYMKPAVQLVQVADGAIGIGLLAGLIVNVDARAERLLLTTAPPECERQIPLEFWSGTPTFVGYVGQAIDPSIHFDTATPFVATENAGLILGGRTESYIEDGRIERLACSENDVAIRTGDGRSTIGSGRLCGYAQTRARSALESFPRATVVGPAAIDLRRYTIDTRSERLCW